MTQFNFKKWNTILGWLAFLVALFTYSSTLEPTVSFWDAGEFILTSSKLEIGHPPGAPLFQMFGAFFSIFTFGNTQYIAMMMNMMSAVASAFTILFMFWSISILLRHIIGSATSLTKSQGQAILGAALVGSLAFAFTDSFWFNAVETEVYAMATLIMAVMFYLGLRWEQDMDKPRGNKWLILISFIVGLSFGVHFMGLLTIPAIGLIYYFKNYKTVTVKNFIIANVVVVAILLFIFKLLAPNILRYFSALEIFFVNSFGLPFNSGSLIAGIILVAAFYFAITYTRKKGYKHLNTGVLCLAFVIIGFSSWLMLPIRANANVVLNENNPSTARELLAYYNLEQYPKTHLFYGPMFTDMYSGLDENNPYVDDKPKYEKNYKTGKYVIINDWKNATQNYNSKHAAILPRMWSPEHAENYMMYTGYLDFKLKPEYQMQNELRSIVAETKKKAAQGLMDYEDYNSFLRQFAQYIDVEKPSLGTNIAFMLEYQLGYMYWRYFMWNFTGRQNDVQGRYTDLNGNWLSGIKFIDELRLGNQDMLASDMKDNKARNTYFFLPLILGVIGLVFHFKNDQKSFWVLLVFFLFTGLALKVYLNERPFEPRERDYALVGSFYVFALWIGYGVYALFDLVKEHLKPKIALPVVLIISALAAPVLLATQNWDDHDRSNRYTAQSMGKMYLDSCDKNAILFTIGDNDTFALWYAQNVEGYRQDVRIINTSLFQTDWYIDDMKKKAFTSDPIPSQLTHAKYRWGTRDFLIHQKTNKDTIDIKTWMNFVANDSPATQMELPSGQVVNTFPSKVIRIPVDKEAVLRNGIVDPKDADLIVPYIDINLKGDVIYKNRMMMLDIIANNNWERPIYFSGGSFGDDDYLWMKDYLQLDGVVYKLVPIKTPLNKRNPFDMGRIDADKMYNIVMSWDWGNSGSPDIYHDTETRRNGITYRSNLARLAEALINEGKMDKAEKILDLAMEKMPIDYFEYYSLLEPFVIGYYELDKPEKARKVYEDVSEKYQEHLLYYNSLKFNKQRAIAEDIISDMERYRSLVQVVAIYDDEEYGRAEAKEFNEYLKLFRHFYSPDEAMDIDKDIEKDSTIEIPLDSNLLKKMQRDPSNEIEKEVPIN
jgi:hypothetical protein